MKQLAAILYREGFVCSFRSDNQAGNQEQPDLVLLQINGTDTHVALEKIKTELGRLPAVIALVERANVDSLKTSLGIDDFILEPCDPNELMVRADRLLKRTSKPGNIITSGDLRIDLDKCEVELGGKSVELTFREYRLLAFLASNPGMVFSRESLLNKVWGYDYFGGDRTVDVHIRRLRSKIEDSTHAFIETVRSAGYRLINSA